MNSRPINSRDMTNMSLVNVQFERRHSFGSTTSKPTLCVYVCGRGVFGVSVSLRIHLSMPRARDTCNMQNDVLEAFFMRTPIPPIDTLTDWCTEGEKVYLHQFSLSFYTFTLKHLSAYLSMICQWPLTDRASGEDICRH